LGGRDFFCPFLNPLKRTLKNCSFLGLFKSLAAPSSFFYFSDIQTHTQRIKIYQIDRGALGLVLALWMFCLRCTASPEAPVSKIYFRRLTSEIKI
jgi:hypothetical protein